MSDASSGESEHWQPKRLSGSGGSGSGSLSPHRLLRIPLSGTPSDDSTDPVVSDGSTSASRIPEFVKFHGKSYDVSEFDHPGGNDIIKMSYATDITALFEKVGHSEAARDILRLLPESSEHRDGMRIRYQFLDEISTTLVWLEVKIDHEATILDFKEEVCQRVVGVAVGAMQVFYKAELCHDTWKVKHLVDPDDAQTTLLVFKNVRARRMSKRLKKHIAEVARKAYL
ncbi:hypothetical protein NPX13_g6696 [Xylaria arbuscula]|uniref:Cytochrome b5 heme-binding domain-containing protein n=1 Tax=Xylaria arbuscula TaxID=114810 RepID=A0A9W8NBZ3_9PEZI|nr:hypothetical protein NPX13_g6696 [Xylaria arbuscula]